MSLDFSDRLKFILSACLKQAVEGLGANGKDVILI